MSARGNVRLLLLALAAHGCSQEVGLLVSVSASSEIGPTHLSFRIARATCGRYAQQAGPLTVEADVSSLAAHPYRLMILPEPGDASETLRVEVVGLRGGNVVGLASVGPLHFVGGQVSGVNVQLSSASADSPWVDASGCFCPIGAPWLAVANQACAAIPSDAARIATGEQCAAPAAPPDAVCDGVAGAAETTDRLLPCYAFGDAAHTKCFAGERTCADQNGVAYRTVCSGDAKWTVPSPSSGTSICDLFVQCDTACADPIACTRTQPPSEKRAITLPGELSGSMMKACDTSLTQDGQLGGSVFALPFGFAVPGTSIQVALLDEGGTPHVVGSSSARLHIDPFAWKGSVDSSFEVPIVVDSILENVTVHFRIVQSCTNSAVDGGGA